MSDPKPRNITSLKDEIIKPIDSKDLNTAAQLACLEAGSWADAASALSVYKNRFEIQECVCLLFAIELYFKAVIMYEGAQQKGHKLFELFDHLKDEDKLIVKEGIVPDGRVCVEYGEEYIELNSFEEELKYISNDFVDLRYEFEKYTNGYPVVALKDFLKKLMNNAKRLAYKEIYNNDI